MPHRDSGLTNDTVRSISVAPDGRHIWFSTSGGIGVYDNSNGTWASYNIFNSGLAHNEVFDIEFDSSGRVWIATADGASLLEGDKMKTFQTGGDSGITYDALRAVDVE